MEKEALLWHDLGELNLLQILKVRNCLTTFTLLHIGYTSRYKKQLMALLPTLRVLQFIGRKRLTTQARYTYTRLEGVPTLIT